MRNFFNKSKFRQMMRYETYKPSGIEWIGDIPKHWEVKRLKNITGVNEVVLPENTPFDYLFKYVDISNVNDKGDIIDIQEFEFAEAPSRARRKVKDGDVIISTVRTYLKAIAYLNKPEENLIVSTGFAVLSARKNKVHPKFQFYQVSDDIFIQGVIANSEGVSYPAISSTKLADLKVFVPSLPEQTSISAHLDSQTQKIDRLIANKKAQVERLKELRQIEINNAVTKGLNPHAPMKDSGIDWLGEIPEHWEVKRLKNVAEVVLGKMLQNDDTGSDNLKPYLRSFNVQWERTDLSDVKEMWLSENEMQQYRLKKFDIVVSEGGEVGRAALWLDEIEECYIQNSVHKVTCRKKVNPYYLLFQFSMLGKAGFFETIINKVSIGHLTREKLVACHFLVPPIAEQLQIAKHLQQRTAAIDKLIKNTEAQIEKLQELRKIKIYEAVTGKVKCHA